VKSSRGARLKGEESYLFTGEYWAGERAVKLGLADAIGDLRTVLRARYGDKVQTPVIAPPTGCFRGLQAASPAQARHCLAFRFLGRSDFSAGRTRDLGALRIVGWESDHAAADPGCCGHSRRSRAAASRRARERRINRELDAARKPPAAEQERMPKLRRDPDTGTYRAGLDPDANETHAAARR
jgi:ClpP class serine protease